MHLRGVLRRIDGLRGPLIDAINRRGGEILEDLRLLLEEPELLAARRGINGRFQRRQEQRGARDNRFRDPARIIHGAERANEIRATP